MSSYVCPQCGERVSKMLGHLCASPLSAAGSPNPKQAYGDRKVPLHLNPPAALAYMALGFGDGAVKYGSFNWRQGSVEAQTYIGAALRHLLAWQDGQELADDSELPHLAHALACLAILVDAQTGGFLIDNRPPAGAMPTVLGQWQKPGLPQHPPEPDRPVPVEPPGMPSPLAEIHDAGEGGSFMSNPGSFTPAHPW
jgi:hypothetical protein